MTMRERMLAVLRGEPMDRVPFAQYDNLAAPNEEVWSVVGRPNMGIVRWVRVHELEHPHCRFETEDIERNGRRGLRRTLHTPEGSLTEEKLYEPAYGSASTREHFVKRPEDYRVLRAYLRDLVVGERIDRFHRQEQALGDDGVVLVAMERAPFPQLWIQWVSIQDLSYHLVDCPGVVEECAALMEDVNRRIIPIVREAGVHYVDFPDNVTTPLVSPDNYRRYCMPIYRETVEAMAEHDVPVFVHMDGDIKPLWYLIGETGIRGIDSLSPPPDNDTDVGEAVRMWPEMRVFANFPSSVHLAPPGRVYERAMEMLRDAGDTGRLLIQISENVPAEAWPRSFPEIIRAIEDFGPPGA
jgi:hypothetical protein